MSFKLFTCILVLTLALLACEGESRGYFRNPKYRVVYYRNQGNGGDPVAVPIKTADLLVQNEEEVLDYDKDENDNSEDKIGGQKKGLSEDIHSYMTGSVKMNPNELRPILYSMGRQLRHLVRAHNQSEVTNKNILSVLEDTLAWAKTQASSFYSLISTFKNRSLFRSN